MKRHHVFCRLGIASILMTLCVGCMTTKIQQHNIGCFDRSKADVVRSATALLVQNGFNVTMADTIVGIVQGETEPQHDIWSGQNTKRVWQVTVKPELAKSAAVTAGDQAVLTAPPGSKPLYVVATAKTVSSSQNAFGATLSSNETYYDDSAHEDWEWYWDVRKGLEGICGTKAVITTKKMH